MKHLIFDVEADGLLDEASVIHSLVLRCLDTNRVISCTNADPAYHSIEYGLSLLSEAGRIYGHNIIGFDLPVLKKLHGFVPTATVRDTLVMVRYRYAHIKELDFETYRATNLPGQLIGSQGLEAWGHRLKKYKGEYKLWCKANGIENPFEIWRPEMQTYCEGDTDVNRDLVLRLRSAGALPAEATETEHELAEYLYRQERNGWPFDVESAIALQAKLTQRRFELGEVLKDHFGGWYKPEKWSKEVEGEGAVSIPKVARNGTVVGSPLTKIKHVEFNPGSRDHITRCLKQKYGWKATSFTETGKAQVDEKSLKGLDIPIASELKEYLLVDKRLGQLAEGKEAWLKAMTDQRPHGGKLTGMMHIHHSVSVTAITHRHCHSHPNLGQVPKVSSPYGPECRALFCVPEGWVQIGADASGLELRCLSHYMAKYDGGAYGKAVVEGKNEDGTDIHTVNRIALGAFLPQNSEGRDKAKTFIYAYLYGAGDQKLGSIVAPGAKPSKQKDIGGQLRKQFESGLKAMGLLVQTVKLKAQKKRYLITLDGRRVYCRHQHAALNTLLQCAGAIICKRWIVHYSRVLTKRFGEQGWDGQWAALGWVHDEVQLACRPEIADEVCKILVEEMQGITEHFHFRVPLTGEAKIGKNWQQTH